jgi:hypothetical protein
LSPFAWSNILIVFFETAEMRCSMDRFKKYAGLKEEKLYSFVLKHILYGRIKFTLQNPKISG